MPKQSATIYDVAELANVSIATVSRVLNGGVAVRSETRARVDQAIRQLHFVPSTAARSLSGGRRHSIGLAYPLDEYREAAAPTREDDASVLYTDGIIRGASWQAAQLGYLLFACAIGNESVKGDQHPLQQLQSSVDGIILTDQVANNTRSMRIAKRMHSVHLSGSDDSKFGATLRADNEGGMRALVAHLVETHDVRDFGFMGGVPSSSDAQARERAFTQALLELGGTIRPENRLVGDFSMARAHEAMSTRLAHHQKLPQAFVCANDQMALGAMQGLRQHNLEVPRDITVTGFDDIALASQTEPSLTTVRQPSFALGVAAVNMVIGLLDGSVPMGTIETLPVELVVRRSCGCPEEMGVASYVS
jgi:LacI family transcriptional regulator